MLGEAAITLHRVACALDSVRGRLTDYGPGLFQSEERARPYADLERLGQDMEALGEELSGELGREHAAVGAFADARAAVDGILETLGPLRDADVREGSGAKKVVDATVARMEDDRARFDACRNRFMDSVRASRG